MSSSDEELMMVLLLNYNNNVQKKRKQKYWVHPYLKNVDTLGTFSVAKVLSMFPEQFQTFYRIVV